MTRGCEQWGSVGSTAIPVRVSGNLRPPHLSGRSGSSAESASAGQGTGDQIQSSFRLGAASWGLSTNLFILVDQLSENRRSQPSHLSGGAHLRVTVQASPRSKCVSLEFCTSKCPSA